MILAGDVGGTKTVLALFRSTRDGLRVAREATYPSADWRSFEAMAVDFLARGRERAIRCAVGVAGPVSGGRTEVVNLAWTVDARRVGRALGIAGVEVLNDLVATAWGLSALPARRARSLTPGLRPGAGSAVLIAAGTGLGMGLMIRNGTSYAVGASEGGHIGFAPRDEVEDDLLRFLRARHGRASAERALSGDGLGAIYDFLVESGRGKRTVRMRAQLAAAADRNAVVARAALDGSDATAGRALDRFVSIYGAVAGDLALVADATAGVWVGGGIAPKILPRLLDGGFVAAFRDKGRLTPRVERIPVRVILEPRTALLGAAARAASPSGRLPAPLGGRASG